MMFTGKNIRHRFSTRRKRALALIAAHVLAYLTLGNIVILPGIPDDEWAVLDQWMRSAMFAVVRPTGKERVTYVDIDDELYRDTWGMPSVTPRHALVDILAPLATAGAAVIVVDIDLAWGDEEPHMRAFLEDYSGPAPLVFVRHIEETGGDIREIDSPYDDIFISNAEFLRWAHAYFLNDADGALREWLPWIGLCENNRMKYLPSVASLIAKAKQPTLASEKCTGIESLPAHPIIYTETFADADVLFASHDSAALKLPAKFILDGTRIDYAALIADRVAIVGGSHTAGQDIRLTPVGLLPGAVVQANTVLHAQSQLASALVPEWLDRIAVAALFALLCLVAFPVSAIPVLLVAWTAVSVFSHFGIFAQIQNAVLLYVQLLVLTWLAKPFWKEPRELGWRILLPEYLREEQED